MAAAGELGVLRALRPYLARPTSELTIAAPDDDAAVWRARDGLEVQTIDTMVEDVDFRPRWPEFDFRLLGRRLMAINLSDLAAMGARPRYALIAACLPRRMRLDQVRRLYRGIADQAARFGCLVAGGDLSAIDGPLVLTAALTGEVPRGRHPLTRTGARPGWSIAVTGRLGAAALGLRALEGGGRLTGAARRRCVRALLDPEPRVSAGLLLAECGIPVAGDISDGLFREVEKLAAPAGLGATIDVGALPLDASLGRGRAAWRSLAVSEDFELVCAAPAPR
ncbi:MAG TPA: thiamine-phosphate kinase, partial [Candidatus Limnocylindrales bacterium]|nr:thiamine-phosphate kinase [Candidatus Limnocylindrales bacterium]